MNGIALSFDLIQKTPETSGCSKKIKENPIAPRVFPCLRAAKAGIATFLDVGTCANVNEGATWSSSMSEVPLFVSFLTHGKSL